MVHGRCSSESIQMKPHSYCFDLVPTLGLTPNGVDHLVTPKEPQVPGFGKVAKKLMYFTAQTYIIVVPGTFRDTKVSLTVRKCQSNIVGGRGT